MNRQPYKAEKRRKEIARQKKQEEKRQKRAEKKRSKEEGLPEEGAQITDAADEGQDAVQPSTAEAENQADGAGPAPEKPEEGQNL